MFNVGRPKGGKTKTRERERKNEVHRANQKYREELESIAVRRSTELLAQEQTEREKSRVRGYCTRRKQAKACKGEAGRKRRTYYKSPS